MKPLVALCLLAAFAGSTAALGDDPSQAPTPYGPGVLPRVDRNSAEGAREWMDFIGTLRFAPLEGERGCPNRLALMASLGWGEGGRAAFADYLERDNEAQRLIANLAIGGADALLSFCFSSNPCIRDFVRPHFARWLLGRAKDEGIPATPSEQESVEAAIRQAERPISPITSIGAAKWVDDFAVAEVHRSGSGCVNAAFLWRHDNTMEHFSGAELHCY